MLDDGIRGVVLDLRGNSGGSVHHAKLFADALLDGGAIGGVRLKESRTAHSAERECLLKDMPLAVLIDGKTRGTAEWLAAALQDNGRAIVLGERSSGDPWVRRGVPIEGVEYVFLMATGVLERRDGTLLGFVAPDQEISHPEAIPRAVTLLREQVRS